ncbi:MAG TPA: hypothetical protein VES21_03770 [Nocardioidaceae bacterium]|nr:hypothetical protein [Nocardioidaceae bacterium]
MTTATVIRSRTGTRPNHLSARPSSVVASTVVVATGTGAVLIVLVLIVLVLVVRILYPAGNLDLAINIIPVGGRTCLPNHRRRAIRTPRSGRTAVVPLLIIKTVASPCATAVAGRIVVVKVAGGTRVR